MASQALGQFKKHRAGQVNSPTRGQTTKTVRSQFYRQTTRFFVAALALFLVQCETEEDNKIAQAQECFNQLRDTSTDAAANACLAKIDGIETSQAYVLRCSVYFFLGGVKSADIIQAFTDMDNATTNDQPGILMSGLRHATVADAERTVNACKKSKTPSLDFIASMSYMGTLMIDDEPGNSTNPNDFLAHCAAAPGNCDDAVIGNTVTSMYNIYCLGDNVDEQICRDIGSAQAAAGNDPALLAQALYLFLD